MITIGLADFERMSSTDICRMHELLVKAYAFAEVEIWGENYVRISLEDFEELIRKEEILVAYQDGIVVGSVHTFPISDTSFCFGLLSADFDYKGLGIGRTLVEAAEKRASDFGKTTMELEILRPAEFVLKSKEGLKSWYERLGYQFAGSMTFLERKPDKIEKAKLFKVPSVFDCYQKELKGEDDSSA